MVAGIKSYFIVYIFIMFISFLLVSIDGQSILTSFSGVVSCFNNVGPGLDSIGPADNYSIFSIFSKIVLIIDMLAGRLEIFPIMILFSGATWSIKR